MGKMLQVRPKTRNMIFMAIKDLVQFSSHCLDFKNRCDVVVSLTGSKSTSSKDTAQGPKEEDQAGHPGYGANKSCPYIDE